MTASLCVQVLHLCWLVRLQRRALQLLQQSGSRAWRLGPKQRPTPRAPARQQPVAGSSMDRPLQQLPLCQQSLVLVQVIWHLECYHCLECPSWRHGMQHCQAKGDGAALQRTFFQCQPCDLTLQVCWSLGSGCQMESGCNGDLWRQPPWAVF